MRLNTRLRLGLLYLWVILVLTGAAAVAVQSIRGNREDGERIAALSADVMWAARFQAGVREATEPVFTYAREGDPAQRGIFLERLAGLQSQFPPSGDAAAKQTPGWTLRSMAQRRLSQIRLDAQELFAASFSFPRIPPDSLVERLERHCLALRSELVQNLKTQQQQLAQVSAGGASRERRSRFLLTLVGLLGLAGGCLFPLLLCRGLAIVPGQSRVGFPGVAGEDTAYPMPIGSSASTAEPLPDLDRLTEHSPGTAAPREEAAACSRERIFCFNTVVSSLRLRPDLDSALDELLEKAVQCADADIGILYLMDQQRGGLVEKRRWGTTEGISDCASVLPPGLGLAGIASASGEPVFVDDVSREHRLRGDEVGQRGEMASGVWVPFKSESGVAGVMVLGWRVRRAFTLEDTPLAEAIGRIAGIVIENCHLYEESRQQASETRKLLEVAMRISSHLDRQKLLEAIAREASLLLDIPQVSIFLYDAERDELLGQAVHGQVPVAIQEMRVPLSFSQTATEAIRSGIPVVVEDTATDARVPRELVERVGIKASLVIPLGRNSRPCGLLFLDELHGPRQFTQHELEVGRSFADQVAMALENSRLFEERERRLQELSTILETARSVSSTLILRDLLQVVVQRLQGLLKCDTYCLYLADAAGKCLNPVIAEGPHAEQVLTRKIPWGESFTGDVIARGRGEILNDAHLSGRSRRIPGTPLEPESLLCVPLMSRGQVFGGLRLGKFGEGNHFHPHDLEVCEILAGHVGSGVDNAWLHEETVRRLDELSVLHQVASAGATILDLETLLEKTTDVVARVLGYEHFAVLLLDESSEHLRLVAGRGFPSELEGMFTIPLGNGITGVCALKGEAQLVLDVAQDSRYIQATPGTKSEMCAPLRVGERVIGVLNVESARPAAFSDVDLRLLQTLAGEVGLMIERSRLFEQVQRRAEEMESVYRIGAAATSSLSLQDVLKVAYEQISRLMDVSTFYIALYDQATDELRFVIDVDKGVFSPESRRILSERPGLTGWVIHSRKPLLLSNVATERPQLPVEAIVIGEEPESWLGVPLLHQNRLIGVMSVQSYEKNAFDLNHQRLLESVATQVAAAIEHARLFEELNGAYEELKRTQAQLVQAEKMSAVGQLAAGVAHELNNPLGGILEYAQFMLEKARVKGLERMGESDLQNWLRYTGRIERESQRCKEIVQSLLRFSRASGEDFGPVQINDVLDDTLLFTQHQLSLANVEVIRELSTDLPFIQGSSNQLQQVFTNLIVNAKLAMPDGGKLILRTSLGPDPGQVRVDIEDTGCGIAEENLPRIFDPFFTTRTVGEGTGLGLYVSYRIVRDHQGMIEVQSERGRGTTFALSFPAGA